MTRKLYVWHAMAASAVMRILVQRVTSASVTVGGDVVGAITPDSQGLLALVGVTHTDDTAKAQRRSMSAAYPWRCWHTA